MNIWEYLDRRGARIAKSPASQWGDPRVAITAALIGLFAYAYIHNPTEAMTGALIAAFAAAYGYWIGASKGAATLNENLGKSLDLVQAAQSGGTTDAAAGGELVADAAQDAADQLKPKGGKK